MRPQRSFTLIELLVVIAIIGLIASMVMVSMGGSRQSARIAKSLEFGQSLHNALGVDAVGAWDFDEGSGTEARDGSGYGNDGTINGATYDCADTPYDSAGVGSDRCALQFDGASSYVCTGTGSCQAADSIAVAGSHTYSAWIKTNAAINGQIIMTYSSARPYWRMQLYTSGSDVRAACWYRVGGSNYNAATPFGAIQTGRWHHVVCSYNADSGMKIYVDGSERGSNSQSGATTPGSGTFYIGRDSPPGASYFVGLIDDVRIYAQALTLGQIQQLYVEGLSRYQLSIKQ